MSHCLAHSRAKCLEAILLTLIIDLTTARVSLTWSLKAVRGHQSLCEACVVLDPETTEALHWSNTTGATLHGCWVSMAVCSPQKLPMSQSTLHQVQVNWEKKKF